MRNISLGILLFVTGFSAHGALVVKIAEPTTVSSKTAVKLTIKNTFSERVESARATVFLLDSQEKVVGQTVKWVIGGSKDRPPLKADSETTFNFVITDAKPFSKMKVMFNRVILENGKLADAVKDVEISFSESGEKK